MSAPSSRVSVKLFGREPNVPDSTFVSIFHEWIRDRALDLVLIDVADYSHVPNGPGIMLMAHSTSFALDRSDGRFGLRAQQRRPSAGDPAEGMAETIRLLLLVAGRLESDSRLRGHVAFDRELVRVESNDRLRAPNTDAGFASLLPTVQAAMRLTFPGQLVQSARTRRPSRERLAIDAVFAAERIGTNEAMQMRLQERSRVVT